MRYGLRDVLIGTAVFTLANLLSSLCVERKFAPWLWVPLGTFLYLVVTPPLYRWLRLMPLMLPRCPQCKLREGYDVESRQWPKIVGTCFHCQQRVELWWRPPAPEAVSKTIPSILLVWPESIGRWKSLPVEAKDKA